MNAEEHQEPNAKLHVIRRSDLYNPDKKKSLEDISVIDNPYSIRPIQIADMVVFVDDDRSVKVLKNRWGPEGFIISREQHEEYLRLKQKEKYENNKSYNSSKKNSFLGRIFAGNWWPFD